MTSSELFYQSPLGVLWQAIVLPAHPRLNMILVQALSLLIALPLAKLFSLWLRDKLNASRALEKVPYALTVLCIIGILDRLFWTILSSGYLLDMALHLSFAFLMISLMTTVTKTVVTIETAQRKIKTFFTVLFISNALLSIMNWKDLFLREFEKIAFEIGDKTITLLSLINMAVILFSAFLLSLYFSSVLKDKIKKNIYIHGNAEEAVIHISHIAVTALCFIIGLSLAGIDITLLSVFSGALGIALGLGLQGIASNYVSGLLLLIENKIRIGDIVSIKGFKGTIKQMSARVTTVEQFDGSSVFIPNSFISTNFLENLTADKGNRIRVELIFKHDADVSLIKKTIRKALAEESRVLSSPSPSVLLSAVNLDGMVFIVNYWINDIRESSTEIADHVLELILEEMRNNHISFSSHLLKVNLINDQNKAF